MLVYLHGLNSSARSHKAGLLREALKPFPVRAPTYPAHRPTEAIRELERFFGQLGGDHNPLVVGSSMGGFYGQYLARRFRFAGLYLINPALEPWNLLPEYLGQEMTTADGEAYRITGALVAETRRFGVERPCDGVETTLFMDRGDEVIDYRVAESIYRDCGRLRIFDGGDHAFQHMDALIAELRAEIAARA